MGYSGIATFGPLSGPYLAMTSGRVLRQPCPSPKCGTTPLCGEGTVNFVGGIATTCDAEGTPTTLAAYDRTLPRASKFARDIVKDSGYTLRPMGDIEAIDKPNYRVAGKKREVVIRESVKRLKLGVICTTADKPMWIMPTGAVDKKTMAADGTPEQRSTYDARAGNDQLHMHRQRFEGLKYMCCCAVLGWVCVTVDNIMAKGY